MLLDEVLLCLGANGCERCIASTFWVILSLGELIQGIQYINTLIDHRPLILLSVLAIVLCKLIRMYDLHIEQGGDSDFS